MNKKVAIDMLSPQIKLVRVESDYTQEEMADHLGMSKKTLIQIEKGRQQASWSHIVTLCALFQESTILHYTLGDDPLKVLQLVAHRHNQPVRFKTMGGKVWWKEIQQEGGFVLQKNLIVPIYRILDKEDYLWHYSFDNDEIEEQFHLLVKRQN